MDKSITEISADDIFNWLKQEICTDSKFILLAYDILQYKIKNEACIINQENLPLFIQLSFWAGAIRGAENVSVEKTS